MEQLPPLVEKLIWDLADFHKGTGEVKQGLKATEDAAKQHSAGASGALSSIGTGALAVGAGVLAIGGSMVAVGLKSADEFSKVGGEVAKLQRYTDGSAESMSRLRYVAQMSGIDNDKLANSLKFLSKDLMEHPEKFRKYGIAVTDATGKMLPLDQVLASTAEKFAGMKNGAEKNDMAMQLLGKSGMDLIPMLNKGKAGFADASAEAEKYGLVLSQDNVDAVKKATLAHRHMDAAMSGLQIQIGQYVLPLVAALTGWFAEKLPLAIGFVKVAVGWLKAQWDEHYDSMKAVWDYVSAVVVTTVVPALITALLSIKDGLIATIGFLGDHKEILIGVAAAIAVGLVAAFVAWAVSAASAAIATIAAVWPIILVAAAIGLLVAGLIYAYNHWDWFRTVVDNVVTWIKENVPPIWEKVRQAIAAVVDWLVNTAWPLVRRFVELNVSAFQHVWSVVGPIFFWIKDRIGDVVSWLVNTAWPFAQKFIASLAFGFAWLADKIGPIFDTVVRIVKGAINALISVWDGFVDHINFHFDLPSILGGGHYDLDLRHLHVNQLAAGGYATARPGGHLVNIAEAGSDEIVSPVPQMRRIVREESGGGGVVIHIEIHGSVVDGDKAILAGLDRAAQNGQLPPNVRAAFKAIAS